MYLKYYEVNAFDLKHIKFLYYYQNHAMMSFNLRMQSTNDDGVKVQNFLIS